MGEGGGGGSSQMICVLFVTRSPHKKLRRLPRLSERITGFGAISRSFFGVCKVVGEGGDGRAEQRRGKTDRREEK